MPSVRLSVCVRIRLAAPVSAVVPGIFAGDAGLAWLHPARTQALFLSEQARSARAATSMEPDFASLPAVTPVRARYLGFPARRQQRGARCGTQESRTLGHLLAVRRQVPGELRLSRASVHSQRCVSGLRRARGAPMDAKHTPGGSRRRLLRAGIAEETATSECVVELMSELRRRVRRDMAIASVSYRQCGNDHPTPRRSRAAMPPGVPHGQDVGEHHLQCHVLQNVAASELPYVAEQWASQAIRPQAFLAGCACLASVVFAAAWHDAWIQLANIGRLVW